MIKGIEAVAARVADNFMVAEGIYEMWLEAPGPAAKARPGQFVMIRPAEGGRSYLRRPMGIYDVDRQGGQLAILYEVHGAGTERLALARKGDVLPLLAPLGNGFTIPEGLQRALVIGGGIGVAPLYPLLCQLKAAGVEAELLLGAQCAERLLALDRLPRLGVPVQLYTDNGTMGKQGYPTDDLPRILREGCFGQSFQQVFCCGPMPLMRGVARICEEAGVACQVSLEERMGCGFGICVCCVVDVHDDSAEGGIVKRRVCYDGPVFDSREVIWHD